MLLSVIAGSQNFWEKENRQWHSLLLFLSLRFIISEHDSISYYLHWSVVVNSIENHYKNYSSVSGVRAWKSANAFLTWKFWNQKSILKNTIISFLPIQIPTLFLKMKVYTFAATILAFQPQVPFEGSELESILSALKNSTKTWERDAERFESLEEWRFCWVPE